MKRISVIGAGIMGAKIALCYSKAGYEVCLYSRTDKTLNRAKETIGKSGIYYTTDLYEAARDAEYVVETVSEVKELKREIYEKLDSILPLDAYISSNTSYLNIFELMPERRLPFTAIVHWFAPADIIPLVEIVKGEKTSENTISEMENLHKNCGKTPIVMQKYIPGFIINRLQSAMNREIIGLISNGYCSPEAIDIAVKSSLMPRGMLLGVIQRMDFGGIDTTAHGIENGSFIPFDAPGKDNAVSNLANSGDLGIKTGKGFYDYSEIDYAEAVRLRDERLGKCIELSNEFINNPIGKIREEYR